MASRSAKPSLREPTPDEMRCRLRMALSVCSDRLVGAEAARISQSAVGITLDIDAVQFLERRVHGVRFTLADGRRIAAETKVVGLGIDKDRRFSDRLSQRDERGCEMDDLRFAPGSARVGKKQVVLAFYIFAFTGG